VSYEYSINQMVDQMDSELIKCITEYE